ncbi:uncharacterized protein LOC103506659 [Caligus rogercresseyi]|uniref:Uncharacterized protein LOC103506659 n=1 Tax=Caligus rogercresseyi TaxID=217165 RepID=A0A7T8KLY5_CALRO|nr:uncharacterized protein LOC103506659 [Caligus rogercresseyi]
MGNPFEEESQDLLILDSKDIAGPAAVETVMNAKKIGQEQFEAFTRECLLDRTKAVDDPIPRNKLKVFSTSTPRSKSKAIVQMLKPAASKTFEEYAHQMFFPYISTKLQTVSRLDLIWDTYLADSLKGSTRAKRGQGVRRRVVAAAAIPGNWQNFLRVDSNKTELFKFLSTALLEWFDQEDK